MSATPINIRMPSVRSLLLITARNAQDLATATGFVAVHDGAHYLVTNWHVVAGRRPHDGMPMSKTGGVPDRLTIMHNVAGTLGTWVPKLEALYDADGDPLWLEHPSHGRKVDVVALPITNLDGAEMYPYDPQNPGTSILATPSNVATIIGFPFGITGGGYLGIWVQGSIASEPEIDFQNLPCFLIDSRTRSGQSGSPVILYRVGGYIGEDGGAVLGGGELQRFVGVYSGRINDQSDLGFVWKASALVDILVGQHRGPLPTLGPLLSPIRAERHR